MKSTVKSDNELVLAQESWIILQWLKWISAFDFKFNSSLQIKTNPNLSNLAALSGRTNNNPQQHVARSFSLSRALTRSLAHICGFLLVLSSLGSSSNISECSSTNGTPHPSEKRWPGLTCFSCSLPGLVCPCHLHLMSSRDTRTHARFFPRFARNRWQSGQLLWAHPSMIAIHTFLYLYGNLGQRGNPVGSWLMDTGFCTITLTGGPRNPIGTVPVTAVFL